MTEILLCLYKQFVSYDRANTEKIGYFLHSHGWFLQAWSHITKYTTKFNDLTSKKLLASKLWNIALIRLSNRECHALEAADTLLGTPCMVLYSSGLLLTKYVAVASHNPRVPSDREGMLYPHPNLPCKCSDHKQLCQSSSQSPVGLTVYMR